MTDDVRPHVDGVAASALPKLMLDAIGQAVIATDLTGIVLYWNAMAETLYGWTADEAVGRQLGELIVPDLDREAATEIFASLSTGTTWSGEFGVRDKNGTPFPVQVTDTGIYDDAGNLIGVIGVSADLSEQKRLDQERRESELRLRTVIDSSPIIVFALDEAARLTLIEGRAALGSDLQPYLNQPISVFADEAPEMIDAVSRCLQGESVDTTLALRDRCFELRYRPRHDDAGRIVGVLGVAVEVTERERAARLTAEREARWQSLVSHSADVALLTDSRATIRYISSAVTRLFGWAVEDLLGRSSLTLVHPEDLSGVVASTRSILRNPDSHPVIEFRVLCADGSYRWVEETLSNLLDEPGVHGLVGNVRDITDRRAAYEAFRISEARYRTIVETAQEAICLLDPAGRALIGNRQLAELIGRPVTDIVGEHVEDLLGAEVREVLGRWWRDGGDQDLEPTEVSSGGDEGSVLLVSASRLAGADSEVSGSVVVISDVSSRKAAEAELARLALHDALTGLPNRTLLSERMRRALTPPPRSGSVGVLFVDIDQFKAVNDSLGHAAGDQLLIAVSERLCAAVRSPDTVARMGGDEFVVFAAGLAGSADAAALAERVLTALGPPICVAGLDVVVTASIGIALVSDDAVTADHLLRRADVAMYRAKARGRNRWELDDPAHQDPAMNQLRLVADLRAGIARDELRVHYQPRVELDTGRVVGVEALVRWQHPERGLLPPAAFVETAENSGLIRDLGIWVLRAACRQGVAWHEAAPDAPPVEIAVNLSARQLADPRLPALVESVLAETGLDPSTLVLEMTETALMADADAALGALRALRSLGLRLAIDDFGTGYSSLVYLKRFPVNELKIDRSFVEGLGTDPEDTAIVTSVIELAHAVGIQAVAEGVETEEQWRTLLTLGCDLAQGYLFARPLPADEVPLAGAVPVQR